ncbi:MAG: universal stress protein [Ideonella sp.]|nr:MAG: universal stress protein [Burkholderiaceae bacterium]MBE7425006.1 universal stress protein [Ideonella sp.]
MLKILLPVDGSEASLDAVRHALALRSHGLAASFVLANVQEPANLYELVTAHDPEVLQRVSTGAGAHLLQPAEALLAEAGAPWERKIASGDPAHVLAEMIESHGIDAVVMGTRGLGSARSAVVGSVSHWLLTHCTVPVTVVRHIPPDDEVE